MKKKILFVLVFVIALTNIVFALTLADLNIEEKIIVEDAVLSADTEISSATFEMLEGIKYTIIYKTPEYIFIKIGDKYIIVQKD